MVLLDLGKYKYDNTATIWCDRCLISYYCAWNGVKKAYDSYTVMCKETDAECNIMAKDYMSYMCSQL